MKKPESTDVLINDLSAVQPASALSETPVKDHWLVIPYEGEVCGKMLWAPVRNQPPEITIPLPALGSCRIQVGFYSSGTVPIWFNLIGGRGGGSKNFNQLRLRLSDEAWFETLTPRPYPGQPRFSYISEVPWREVELTGQSLVLATPKKEAYYDCTVLIAYIRLVPLSELKTWPEETKCIADYMDSNFHGHYVDSIDDVRSRIEPLRESDVDVLFWTTSREDSCYYPTRVGNIMPPDTMPGVYPYWAGRDMKRMLDRGEDPLTEVCRVAHNVGLRVFGSYRRMTRRLPPFVFPLHPGGLFEKRPDLWCADAHGNPAPHLSIAYPEVRDRMLAIMTEQAERYDLDGIHMQFCRGIPLTYFETPVCSAFELEFGLDPRGLSEEDERIWKIRADFFLTFLRDLRSALDAIGTTKGRRLQIAINTVNSVRTCAYYGMDIESMISEHLVDIILPARGHFFPESLGERNVTVEFLEEFVELARGTDVQIRPALETFYWKDGVSAAQRAAMYFKAGAQGVTGGGGSLGPGRFGHRDELDSFDAELESMHRMVKVTKVGGLRFDEPAGIQSVG